MQQQQQQAAVVNVVKRFFEGIFKISTKLSDIEDFYVIEGRDRNSDST